ncbi:hypothetical protein IEO21_02975 [Rhodonia placenta]|uniref:Uncharacterized protein n=1 Tax=Rhodonia placenta TaxID=104341 RepID=A0A8H7P717_9APHY|nr:hypothetical protein IEO21_02975 [Postia placenta]
MSMLKAPVDLAVEMGAQDLSAEEELSGIALIAPDLRSIQIQKPGDLANGAPEASSPAIAATYF